MSAHVWAFPCAERVMAAGRDRVRPVRRTQMRDHQLIDDHSRNAIASPVAWVGPPTQRSLCTDPVPALIRGQFATRR